LDRPGGSGSGRDGQGDGRVGSGEEEVGLRIGEWFGGRRYW
jgi:hypothetical protein